MTRSLIPLISLIALAGCASTDTGQPTASSTTGASSRVAAGGGECNADGVTSLRGQTYSDSLAERARRQSGSAILRVLRPGELMTMEYNPERLTIVIGDDGSISSIRCG